MAFNWEATKTQWFVDQDYNMMLSQNPGWMPNGGNGKGDAIGRTFVAFYCYSDDRFLEGIESCWEKIERKGFLKRLLFGKYYYQGYRYPHRFPDEVGLSRDHTIYTILAYKYAGYSREAIKEFTTHLRFKISDFALFTPELWLWRKAVYGSKIHTWLYLSISLIVTELSNLWNKFVYHITPFEEECNQDEWIKIPNDMKPERIWKWSKRLYPIYALHQHAWQLKVLPDSRLKRRVQKAALKICPKHNYVIKMLLGFKDIVTHEQAFGYRSMHGGRWTGILNPWINDRDLDEITDPERLEANVQDVDYVRTLFNSLQCEPNI